MADEHEPDSLPGPQVPERPLVSHPRRLVIGVATLVIVVMFAVASHYQPLSVNPSWSNSGQPTVSGEVKVSLETTLSNSGPLGVSVLKLQPKVYADSPIVVAPLMPCFRIVKGQQYCGQDSQGFLTGQPFRTFALSGNGKMPVAWQYSFSCRPHPGGSSTIGPVEVSVTYRFFMFTHSIQLIVPNIETSGGSACSEAGG